MERRRVFRFFPSWTPLSGLRVLLADDDADARELLERLLRRAGAEVAAYGDGARAVTAWGAYAEAGRPFEAVVVDHDMPGRRGPEVAAALRIGGFSGPVIGVSATRLPEEVAFWLAAGCDDVVAKETVVRDLVPAVVGQCLHRLRGEAAAAEAGHGRTSEDTGARREAGRSVGI